MALEGAAIGQRYVEMIGAGVVAAQYLTDVDLDEAPESIALVAPVYTYLLSSHVARYQFWLDIGSATWWEPLHQPLTNHYVLTRRWNREERWTDAVDYSLRNRNLYRLVRGPVPALSRRDLPLRQRIGRPRLGPGRAADDGGTTGFAGGSRVRFEPRAGQREILAYQGGLLGVSAVPGSGKTAAIVALATRLIAERRAEGGQVLVVTYQTRLWIMSAPRIGQRLQEMDLLQVGYDVRTLHSLAYGIVQANPGLVGAAAEFVVLDERASDSLLDKAVRTWNDDNKGVWGRLGPGEYVDQRWEQEWRDIARKVARTVITTAKNRRLRAEDLLARLGGREAGEPFFADRRGNLPALPAASRDHRRPRLRRLGVDGRRYVAAIPGFVRPLPPALALRLGGRGTRQRSLAGGADCAIGGAGRQLDPGRRPQSSDYEHLHCGGSALFAPLLGAR